MTRNDAHAMTEPRFVTETVMFAGDATPDVYVGDTIVGEYRLVADLIPGDAPDEIRDRETLAREMVERLNKHRDSLPDSYAFELFSFVYEDGTTA